MGAQVLTSAEPGSGYVLAHLRTETRKAHLALEGSLDLLSEHLDLATYRGVLSKFYGFWKCWEPQMSGLVKDEILLNPRRRFHLLAADLLALGLLQADLDALPECPPARLDDEAEAIGSLYVMEGSTLGGQLIRRNVERCLGGSDQTSCLYFSGYGTQTGRMWRAFLEMLDRVPSADAERVSRGASATFEHLGWWMTQPEAAQIR